MASSSARGRQDEGGLYRFLFVNWGCQYPTKCSHLRLWVTGFRLLHLQTSHNILVVNIHNFSHCLLQVPHTFCPRAKVWVLWQIMLLCPMLETPSIRYCQESWLLSHILLGKFFWKEGTSIQTMGGQRHSITLLWGCPQPDLWNIEQHPNLLGELTPILDAQHSFQLFPQCRGA